MGKDWNQGASRQRDSDYGQAKEAYASAANQRLQNIANGGSASPLASPWLAMSQAYQNHMINVNSGGTDAMKDAADSKRDSAWDKAVAEAKAAAHAQKPYVKPFEP